MSDIESLFNPYRDLRTKAQHTTWLADDREPECVCPSPSCTFPMAHLTFCPTLSSKSVETASTSLRWQLGSRSGTPSGGTWLKEREIALKEKQR